MSFDNKSFFEVSQEFPKRYKNNNRNSRDFPILQKRQGEENNRVEVSQRQSYHKQESPSNKRTYSQIVQRKIDSRTGYDKQAHNELLLSPNGQILQAYNGVMLNRQETNNTVRGNRQVSDIASTSETNIRAEVGSSVNKQTRLSVEEIELIQNIYQLFLDIPDSNKGRVADSINTAMVLSKRGDKDGVDTPSEEEY
ncbi:hypothetical protein JTB14_024003 [Gonioctena quinquepunctata]|nr:hypothetical protein JTB14_024003 [Gonioctena quinquepunctata]